jgi:hypothetical protein
MVSAWSSLGRLRTRESGFAPRIHAAQARFGRPPAAGLGSGLGQLLTRRQRQRRRSRRLTSQNCYRKVKKLSQRSPQNDTSCRQKMNSIRHETRSVTDSAALLLLFVAAGLREPGTRKKGPRKRERCLLRPAEVFLQLSSQFSRPWRPCAQLPRRMRDRTRPQTHRESQQTSRIRASSRSCSTLRRAKSVPRPRL